MAKHDDTTTRRPHPEVRRTDLATEALSEARGRMARQGEALDALEEMLSGTGRGPWPLAHSDYWTWNDGQDLWVVDGDDLRAAVETVAAGVVDGKVCTVDDEGDLDTSLLYQAICDRTRAAYSRIGSGQYTAAELVAEVLGEHGQDAAEEMAEALGVDLEEVARG